MKVRSQTKYMVLLRIVLIAGTAAALGNVMIYSIAQSIGNVRLQVPMPDGSQLELALPMILIMSILPAVGAAGLYFGLSRFTARPLRIFQGTAAVVLLLSLIPLFTLNVVGDVRGYLLAMHVVTAAIVSAVLTVLVRRSTVDHA